MRKSQLPNLHPLPDVGGPKNSWTSREKRIASATWPLNSTVYLTPLSTPFTNRCATSIVTELRRPKKHIGKTGLYITNKYMMSPPSDFSNVRIPALKFAHNGTNLSAIINTDKVEVLASTFFPPPGHTNHPSHCLS